MLLEWSGGKTEIEEAPRMEWRENGNRRRSRSGREKVPVISDYISIRFNKI